MHLLSGRIFSRERARSRYLVVKVNHLTINFPLECNLCPPEHSKDLEALILGFRGDALVDTVMRGAVVLED